VAAERPGGRIEPRLSALDGAMVLVSLVIGVGIFRTPALVASATGSGALFLAAWAIGALVSAAGALTFAEIGARFPRPGAYYQVVAVSFHPALAFALNWAQILMQGAGAAGVAFIGAEYLLSLASGGRQAEPRAVTATAVALMAVLLGLNFAGVKSGARAQNLLSLAKLALLGLLAAAGFLLAPAAPAAPVAVPPPDAGGGAVGLIAGLVAVFYTCGGYQQTMNLAGDLRDAARALPRAIGWGMAAVLVLYLAINAAYLHALGLPGVAAGKLVAADLARAAFGPAGQALVSLAIFLSAAGFVNATILQLPRSWLAMAEDGALPRVFLAVRAGAETQDFALGFLAVTMLVPALFLRSFENLLQYVMFTDALTLVAVASCLFVLRRRRVGEEAGEASGRLFRAPGYPLVPALFVAVLVAVAARILWQETAIAVAGLAIIVAGLPLYGLMRRATR
jgi:APA family basic amino acid/polyamine antiporter